MGFQFRLRTHAGIPAGLANAIPDLAGARLALCEFLGGVFLFYRFLFLVVGYPRFLSGFAHFFPVCTFFRGLFLTNAQKGEKKYIDHGSASSCTDPSTFMCIRAHGASTLTCSRARVHPRSRGSALTCVRAHVHQRSRAPALACTR